MAAAHHAQVMLQVKTFRTFLFEIVNHSLSSQRSGKLIGERNEFAIGVGSRRQHGNSTVILMQPRVSQLHIQVLAKLLLQRRRSRNRVPVAR